MNLIAKDFPIPKLRALVEHAGNRPFRVSFFGRMKAGKSSVINGLLGVSVLPVKTLTTTAVLTHMVSGEAAAEVAFLNGSRVAMSMDEAKAHIVYAKDKKRSVSEVNLSVPYSFLPGGIVLTDTPGIDDQEALNEIAESIIDETDLAVMICDATRFIGESERRFAAKLHNRLGGNVLFVINRVDLVEDIEELDAIANVYLRTFGNSLTGAPTVIHTAVPPHGEKQISSLRRALSELMGARREALCQHARRHILIRHTDEAQSQLLDERTRMADRARDKQTESFMAYMARLNSAKARTASIVSSFEATCMSIIAGEGGILTRNMMTHCLNSVADACVDKFNANVSQLKKEFTIFGGKEVPKLVRVTAAELSIWGIGIYYDQSSGSAVFAEIMRMQRRKLAHAIENTFAEEERRVGRLAGDQNRTVTCEDLAELDTQIISCAAIIDKLKGM